MLVVVSCLPEEWREFFFPLDGSAIIEYETG
jgi:hypothetical protein